MMQVQGAIASPPREEAAPVADDVDPWTHLRRVDTGGGVERGTEGAAAGCQASTKSSTKQQTTRRHQHWISY